ncbi:MAG: 4Fe-4S binding protein [Polyangiaceae bacterium]|jgi:polyferredoxin|nr:4Fe-4S binding protein [Polyangiaceae bacterium]
MACKSDCGCKPKEAEKPARRSLPVLGAGASREATPAFTPTSGDLPSPIPWLGAVGPVAPIDAVTTRSALGVVSAPEAAAPRQDDVLSAAPDAQQEAQRLQREMQRREEARRSSLAAELGLMGADEGLSLSAAAPAATASTGAKARPKKLDPKRPGSGIPARPVIRFLVWLRRVSQAGFFALFLYFLFQTAFRGSFGAKAGDAVRLPLPVEAFLLADPFVGAMTLLSTHTVYRGLLWSLGMLALTLVFGRVFCGWICPFGTMHHFTAWLFPSRVGRGASRVEANKTHTYQRAKYYLLYAFLLAAVSGSAIGGLFDPICVAVRAIGLGVIPAAQYILGGGLAAASESQNRVLQALGDRSADLLASHVWNAKQFYFHQTWFICFLLVAILFMNRFIPRFWCRALCPLGAFLGVFSRFALFGMEKDHAKCTDCNLCIVHCQGADSPQGGVKHRQDECHMCLNCENACPEDVIKFRFLPKRGSTIQKPDTDRRTALATAAAGAVAIPAMRIADSIDANYHSRVIRPPGSVEEREFLERCIRCAECMKVCPNNALHPAFFESGVEGIWTPILIPRIGYCEHSCVLCGQVCPTGAIQKITEKEKLGIDQPPIRIGTAFYDVGRCLPWSMATPCIVCEEFCPTSPKAIWVEEADVPKRSDKPGPNGSEPEMLTVHVQRPHVDPSLCIGCGACEKVCPVQDQPAVYVTNVGETRSKTNVILLEGESYNRT